MLTLAIDTAAAACQAAIHDSDGDHIPGLAGEIIGRGHAERLMAVIEAALDEAGVDLDRIGRVAVTVGPGSFTGIRVGVSAARGLALALGIPSVGVGSLEAIGIPAAATSGSPVLAAIDARRGEVYAQLFDGRGLSMNEPGVMTPAGAAARADSAGASLAGSGAGIVAASAEMSGGRLPILSDSETVDIAAVARIGAGRAGPFEKPKPLYLRSADARPQAGFAVARKD